MYTVLYHLYRIPPKSKSPRDRVEIIIKRCYLQFKGKGKCIKLASTKRGGLILVKVGSYRTWEGEVLIRSAGCERIRSTLIKCPNSGVFMTDERCNGIDRVIDMRYSKGIHVILLDIQLKGKFSKTGTTLNKLTV